MSSHNIIYTFKKFDGNENVLQGLPCVHQDCGSPLPRAVAALESGVPVGLVWISNSHSSVNTLKSCCVIPMLWVPPR